MQEPASSPFARLHVWALTASFATAALILGLLSLPLHLLRRRAYEGYGGPFGAAPMVVPGASPQPWPVPSGAHGWPEWHHAWGGGYAMMHHLSPGIAVLIVISMAIVAGIGGAIVASVYNALLPKK